MSKIAVVAVLVVAAAATAAQAVAPVTGHPRSATGGWRYDEFRLSDHAVTRLRADFVDHILTHYRAGTWAPMAMTLNDHDLEAMGLPPRAALLGRRFPTPTLVTPDGRRQPAAGFPTLATFAGAGFFGIRPGAWLLTVTDKEIGWCSLAHVYGSPGSYQISTAGHCGKKGAVATVIAAAGNRGDATGVVLLDFGRFARSTGDAGIGKDWALINVDPAYQDLVTPTMAFWGGPRGIYTKTGEVVSASLLTKKGDLSPSAAVTPDPLLAQQIVHYGHGAGLGAGGTPRSGSAITWRPTYYAFFGAITPGDSGSGANTLTGDLATTMQAAGINTHIYVDASLRSGLGIMAGTRATQVTANLADGQLVPYPVPAPGLP